MIKYCDINGGYLLVEVGGRVGGEAEGTGPQFISIMKKILSVDMIDDNCDKAL